MWKASAAYRAPAGRSRQLQTSIPDARRCRATPRSMVWGGDIGRVRTRTPRGETGIVRVVPGPGRPPTRRFTLAQTLLFHAHDAFAILLSVDPHHLRRAHCPDGRLRRVGQFLADLPDEHHGHHDEHHDDDYDDHEFVTVVVRPGHGADFRDRLRVVPPRRERPWRLRDGLVRGRDDDGDAGKRQQPPRDLDPVGRQHVSLFQWRRGIEERNGPPLGRREQRRPVAVADGAGAGPGWASRRDGGCGCPPCTDSTPRSL